MQDFIPFKHQGSLGGPQTPPDFSAAYSENVATYSKFYWYYTLRDRKYCWCAFTPCELKTYCMCTLTHYELKKTVGVLLHITS